jgi:hypothetical protein
MQFAIGMTVLECSFAKHSHGPLGVNFNMGLTMFSKELLKFALQVQREKPENKYFPQFPTIGSCSTILKTSTIFLKSFLTTQIGRL